MLSLLILPFLIIILFSSFPSTHHSSLNKQSPSFLRNENEESFENEDIVTPVDRCIQFSSCFSCLSPIYEDMFCKWENNTCLSLTEDEIYKKLNMKKEGSWYDRLETKCRDNFSLSLQEEFCFPEKSNSSESIEIILTNFTDNLFCNWTYQKRNNKIKSLNVKIKSDLDYTNITIITKENQQITHIIQVDENNYNEIFKDQFDIIYLYLYYHQLDQKSFVKIQFYYTLTFKDVSIYVIILATVIYACFLIILEIFCCVKMYNNKGIKKLERQYLIKFLKYPMDFDIFSNKCSICLDEYKKGDIIGFLTRCCHCFHSKCILQWSTSGDEFLNNCCPICHINFQRKREESFNGFNIENGEEYDRGSNFGNGFDEPIEEEDENNINSSSNRTDHRNLGQGMNEENKDCIDYKTNTQNLPNTPTILQPQESPNKMKETCPLNQNKK